MTIAQMKEVKVWYDRKRDCWSTNAAIIAAKKWGIPTLDASLILYERVKDRLKESGIVESMEYEEPGKGILWQASLTE